MARITVEDCQEVISDRFQIIKIAAQRARDIQDGMSSPIKAESHKTPVIALKEIAEGYLTEDGVSFSEDEGEEEF
tara:strand:+ start:378 stop:602 length:225 start_codon:yes stop_codon:yes gene_type:complete